MADLPQGSVSIAILLRTKLVGTVLRDAEAKLAPIAWVRGPA
jgi:hypothetical protein